MINKYFFTSRMLCISYFLYSIPILGMAYLTCIADTFHWWLLLELISCAMFLWFWAIWTISYQIQIDFRKKELHIKHPTFNKKIKFDRIISIDIVETSKISFDLVLTTNEYSKKISYKYFNRRGKWNYKENVCLLKSDFNRIVE